MQKNSKKIKLVLVIIAAYLCYTLISSFDSAEVNSAPATPVEVVEVTRKDVPYYLSGIGTVVSPNSVEIRSRIDGELVAINFEEGQTVKKGDLIAEIDSRLIAAEIAKAKAEKANSFAELQTAKLDLQRYTNLLKADAISKQAVDQQTAKVSQLQAQLQAAQANIEVNEVLLSHTKIASPIDGRVGIRRVDVGNIVKTSDANGIVKITQIQPINAIFSLSQAELPKIQAILHNKDVTVDAILKNNSEILTSGSLVAIDNEVDKNSGTISLRAKFENANNELWPGQLITIRMLAATYKQALIVPIRAIQRSNDGNFVYRIKNDAAEISKVEIEFENSEIAVIKNGLTEKDKVVVEGQSRLKNGAKIRIQQSENPKNSK